MRLIDADALQNILLPITTALEHEYEGMIYEPYKNLKAEAIESWNRRAGEVSDRV